MLGILFLLMVFIVVLASWVVWVFVCCGCCDCWVVRRLVVWLSLFGCLLLVGLLHTGTCVYCLVGFVCVVLGFGLVLCGV